MGQIDQDYLMSRMHAAEKGTAEALYDLGLLYSTGIGVEQDLIEAHKWFNLAVMRGLATAKIDRAEVAQDMSFQQIAAAQKKAREWLSCH